VEDNPDDEELALLAFERSNLANEVVVARDGVEALDYLFGTGTYAGGDVDRLPQVVLLDLKLPRRSGFEVLEQLRADDATRRLAVLMLTARREEPDRIRGLSLGADDYLTKPFSPQELVLRVGAILRRVATGGAEPNGEPGELLVVGPLRIDRAAMTVDVGGQRVDLTPTEYKLLLTLAERRGRVQARGHLLETVWEAAPDIQTRTVDMHVQRLRTKLGDAGDLIETVRGFGYRLKSGVGR